MRVLSTALTRRGTPVMGLTGTRMRVAALGKIERAPNLSKSHTPTRAGRSMFYLVLVHTDSLNFPPHILHFSVGSASENLEVKIKSTGPALVSYCRVIFLELQFGVTATSNPHPVHIFSQRNGKGGGPPTSPSTTPLSRL